MPPAYPRSPANGPNMTFFISNLQVTVGSGPTKLQALTTSLRATLNMYLNSFFEPKAKNMWRASWPGAAGMM